MRSTGFARRQRLVEAQRFRQVFRHGRRVRGEMLVAVVLPGACAHARLGMAVSRRHAGTNVVRNRIKRHIRESFRQVQAELGAVDIVVTTRPTIAHADARALRGELDRLWSRVARGGGLQRQSL